MKIYKHFKGSLYKIICEAQLEWLPTQPQGEMVVYESIDTGKIWIRTKEKFFGEVKVNGEIVKRFEKVEE